MKRKKLKIALSIVGFILLISIGTAAGYAIYLTDKVKQTATESHQELDRGGKSEKRQSEVNPEYDDISVLFVGIDDSEKRSTGGNRNALSDALVLATFNDNKKSIKMVSIPRDSYTYIPEIGYKDKITHAHAFGGIDATVETVEKMFDIPVDYYVRLNFNSFIEVVNSIGGITYDVPFDITEQNSADKDGAIELEKGYQKLNGEEALALARTRKYDSDLARGQRQMELIQEIARQTMTTSSLNNFGDILNSINDNLKTNLTFEEMISFKDYFFDKQGLTFDKMQLNGEGGKVDGVWYYQVKEDSLSNAKDQLQAHLNLPSKNDKNSNAFAEEKENEDNST
ncbi:transcriptional attenuator, LytR family [Halobacillus alkaliphilus]|uniref:Transcriptional attenuator, LytR family n=1 Tax=Halobacillus alkaliphilus TaxID=396056 RepID=A0A1I2KL95_9BACI|nr:LCP family protein [Halobacillus alkaliphilus]SFF67782.1 transcriptional attenuator, LytR family [Halobacillus alkaliphilus]